MPAVFQKEARLSFFGGDGLRAYMDIAINLFVVAAGV
jgi:hypothetical protein